MNQPHNSGLSEKAWDDLHLFIAKMQIKHGKKMAEIEKRIRAVKKSNGII